ncbi:MAG: hypothetical protein NTU53_03615 [Planctomycetota bacterium]|nr:hypothetical protein [Planctomycetota bacterium]
MLHVTAIDLEQWADRITSSSDLPRLLAKLIWASASGLSKLDMPGGEFTRLCGFDGIVECRTGDDMVPKGISAWELSVEKRIATKAERDYVKRTNDPRELDPKPA